jgi:hypothetical protein
MWYSVSDTYKEWQQLGKRRNLDAWEMTPATVNAYFNPPANEVSFPLRKHACSVVHGRSPDRVPRWHFTATILQQKLAWLSQLWGIRSSCVSRANCMS